MELLKKLRVNAKMCKLLNRICPVCGTEEIKKKKIQANYELDSLNEFAFSSRKIPEFMHLPMQICKKCDLLYANEIPAIDWIENGYRYADFNAIDESYYAAINHGKLLKKIVPLLPDMEFALDIGAGDGQFLSLLIKRGFSDVQGVEPSKAPIAMAQNQIKNKIKNCFFNGNAFPENSVSLITCFQTLEHVLDPQKLIKDVYRILKPGGVFYSVSHNYRSFIGKILGTKSPIYDIEHLQLYSRQSLSSLYHCVGFDNIKINSFRNSFPVSYWIKLFPFLSKDVKKKLINLLIFFNKINLPVYAGNLSVIGQKHI